jgi:hypothetical protein
MPAIFKRLDLGVCGLAVLIFEQHIVIAIGIKRGI